jgi:DNA mismatch repair protein MutL
MLSSKSIQLLPEHLIDQIKAGEVIEKPSTLLKELLENSIDAGSMQIDIHLRNAGLDLISVIDNGHGIPFDELPLAFARHATSKIDKFDDLYRLASYGFRGEALASIASVSKCTCTSMPRQPDTRGGKISYNGGKLEGHLPFESTDQGTSIVVQDLFFNTPARLKFVRSLTSEKNALKKMLSYFFLAHPTIRFSIKWDDQAKKIFEPVEFTDWDKRISQVFSEQNVVNLAHEYDDHRLMAFLGTASSKGHAHKTQALFVNGRVFFDKSLQQLIARKSEGLWPQGETGHWAIFLSVPADQLDVNVHPNKTTVKFSKSSLVYSLISGALDQLAKLQAHQVPQAPPSSQLSLHPQTSLTAQAKDFDASPYQESFVSHQLPLGSGNRDFQFLSLTRKYSLYSNNQKHFLFQPGKILGRYLLDYLERFKLQLPDDQITPLLISEPFKVGAPFRETSLQELKKVGLELDQLDQQTLVLRTIPQCLENFNRRLIVGELLSAIALEPQKTLAEQLRDFLAQHLPLPQLNHQLEELLVKELEERFWYYEELKLIIMIDDHILDKL